MAPKQDISPSQIDAKISEFEKRLDRLYRMYEQYFIGVEKRPPRNERRQVVRLYRELEQLPKLKTSLKFRFRSMVQRFNSYKAYWDRTERQIEEGTYHRDVARAKARKKRHEAHEKEKQQPEASGRADDGAIEIDDLDIEDMDLESLEDELQQMEQRGEFEKYAGTGQKNRDEDSGDGKPHQASNQQAAKQRPAAESGGWDRPKVDENVKKKRLAELQAKLGLSSRGGGDSSGSDRASPSQSGGGETPIDRSAGAPTQKARPENPSAPSRGADMSKIRQLRRAKKRIEREQREGRSGSGDSKGSNSRRGKRGSGSKRVIRRDTDSSKKGGSSDDNSRKIYDSLVEAKRRCNEDTSGLNYNSFKKTMDRQRTQIQKKKGARNVDFKVVIKDGRAFLKPETKK